MCRTKFKGICSQCDHVGLWSKRERLCSKCFDQKHHQKRSCQPGYREAECLRAMESRHENRASKILYQLNSKAKKTGIEVELTENWLKEQIDIGYCSLTGLPFEWKAYKKGQRGGRSFFTPSVDRIDNSRGYTPNNCRITISGYNIGKNNYTDREMMAMSVSLLANSIPKKNLEEFIELLPANVLACLPNETNWLN